MAPGGASNACMTNLDQGCPLEHCPAVGKACCGDVLADVTRQTVEDAGNNWNFTGSPV